MPLLVIPLSGNVTRGIRTFTNGRAFIYCVRVDEDSDIFNNVDLAACTFAPTHLFEVVV